ncbi:MAG: hypothetical protein JSS42_14155 [Proteobacteria bacterium]|uniref:hypothetical protein n=1 Tax=Rudaea sp. TaxID=2136325 RepID=UPI00321F8CC3|nr:hypothetical protein [Pseudomonadota bacterium]
MRGICLISSLLVAAGSNAAETTHYIDLVNTAKNSITTFSVAPAGSNHFRALPFADQPLHGGGDSATVAIRGNECLVDLRTEFGNGRVLIQKNFDVCKYRSYHTGQYLRGNAQTTVAATP